jgi:hypothetical protein
LRGGYEGPEEDPDDADAWEGFRTERKPEGNCRFDVAELSIWRRLWAGITDGQVVILRKFRQGNCRFDGVNYECT